MGSGRVPIGVFPGGRSGRREGRKEGGRRRVCGVLGSKVRPSNGVEEITEAKTSTHAGLGARILRVDEMFRYFWSGRVPIGVCPGGGRRREERRGREGRGPRVSRFKSQTFKRC